MEKGIDIKKIIKETAEETTRQNAILIEDIQSNFKMFGEVLSGVSDKLEKVEKKVDMNFEEIGRVKMEVLIIKEDVSVLKEDVSDIKIEMKHMNGRLDNIEEEVKSLRKDFDLANNTGNMDFMKEIKDRLVIVEKHLGLNII